MNSRQKRTPPLLGIAAVLVLATNGFAAIINVGPGDSIQAAIDAAVEASDRARAARRTSMTTASSTSWT